MGASIARVDFSNARLTVSRRNTKPGKPWRAVIAWRDGDGKRQFVYRQFPAKSVRTEKAAKAEANRWFNELRAEQERDAAQEKAQAERDAEQARIDSMPTVGEYVAEYVEQQAAADVLEPSTCEDYRKSAKRIAKTIGGEKVCGLGVADVQRWQHDMEGRYSHGVVKKTRNLLGQAMGQAVLEGLVDSNPVVAAKRTRTEKLADKAARKENYLDLGGRSVLLGELDSIADAPVTIAARLAMLAGLREGEVCALMWRDVDLSAGFLTVRHAIGMDGGRPYLKRQKNDATFRDVPIMAELAVALRRWRATCARAAMQVGADLGMTYVIGDPTRPVTQRQLAEMGPEAAAGAKRPDYLAREWRNLARLSKARGELGQPVQFHNLRHTFGTLMANDGGVSAEDLARLMGHANTSTTKRYYIARDREKERAEGMRAVKQAERAGAVREPRGEVLGLGGATGTDGR